MIIVSVNLQCNVVTFTKNRQSGFVHKTFSIYRQHLKLISWMFIDECLYRNYGLKISLVNYSDALVWLEQCYRYQVRTASGHFTATTATVLLLLLLLCTVGKLCTSAAKSLATTREQLSNWIQCFKLSESLNLLLLLQQHQLSLSLTWIPPPHPSLAKPYLNGSNRSITFPPSPFKNPLAHFKWGKEGWKKSYRDSKTTSQYNIYSQTPHGHGGGFGIN